MSDIKIFKIQGNIVNEIKGTSVALEKSLQALIEKNLEEILGIKFLATEYTTDKTHRLKRKKMMVNYIDRCFGRKVKDTLVKHMVVSNKHRFSKTV